MKGIKGERKAYGIKSPMHRLLTTAGIDYQGTRLTNGYQRAHWYIYGTEPNEIQPDLAHVCAELEAAGWRRRNDLDGNPMAFPERGTRRGDGHWQSFSLETYINSVLHTIQLVSTTYEKKPARNHISVNEITYPG